MSMRFSESCLGCCTSLARRIAPAQVPKIAPPRSANFKIVKFAERGGAIFGTCAGAILLAKDVQHPRQDSLNLMDMTVVRNAYGRQIASDVVRGPTVLKKEPLEMVFIRGPVIERAGPGVKVLAEYAGKPALVQRENILAATFHPELTDDTTVHEHFLRLAGSHRKRTNGGKSSTRKKRRTRHKVHHAI